MPRHNRNQVPEKSKDFKGSMKRLLTNLKNWKILLYFSLLLAMISAIFSLIAPNKLSELTDTITKGISPKIEILEEINNEMNKNLNIDNLKKKTIEINNSNTISEDDKKAFNTTLKNIASLQTKSDTNSLTEINSLIISLPNSILEILFSDIKVNNKTIKVDSQIKMLNLTKEMLKNGNNEENLIILEKLPKDIYNLIKPSIDINKVLKIALFMTILYISSSIFNYIQSFSMTTISNNFAKKLRTNISKKINTLPLKYFDNHETGDILSRITNDVDTIAQNLNQSLATLVTSITLFIGSIIMMFYTNWIMAITAIISSLIGFMLMFLILGKSQKYFIKKQTELGKLNGYIEEMYSGHNVVKAYNGTKKAIEEFKDLNQKLYEANQKSQFLSGLMHPIMGFIGNFGYVMVCIIGALLVNNGNITFGVIVAFMIYVRLFTNPLTQMAQAMTSLQSVAAASERVFEFQDEEQMSSQDKIKKHLPISKTKGKIEFKNVKFGYDKDKTIIKDFSINVKPGQKIAIVGPTGAGKTTIVNLLMKFYEISSGDILIDGISINELSRENIHELFCMVLQDTWLFEGTIGENIRFNKEEVTNDEIWEVCKTVGVDHFIKTLPGGLDAIISDNDTISSGQKQLFTIARGMLEDAPFLILDEATSNVDTRTEEVVQKAMDKLTHGRTSFIIAHRLSTIKNADVILVMKEGNIIETGTHKELMEQNGFYAELYNSQFELQEKKLNSIN